MFMPGRANWPSHTLFVLFVAERAYLSLVVLRLGPSSACGVLPEIRQDGLPKPGGPPGMTTDPYLNFSGPKLPNRPPLKKLNVRA